MTWNISTEVLAGNWHVLGTTPTERMASLLIEPAEQRVRVALDAEGVRHLLVPTALPARPWSQVDSPLKDSVRNLVFAGSASYFLDVRCNDPRLFDVFDELIVDVLESDHSSSDLGAAVDAALRRWRAMFRALALSGFGRQQRFGLFAELLVLESCINLVGANALASWIGPSGSSHDFELPKGCLEVKAIGSASPVVTIHGFGQLSIDRGRPLHLLVYTLDEAADGRTLKELISSIENVTGEGSLAGHLAMVGYTSVSHDERLAVVDSIAVQVNENLPALSDETVADKHRQQITSVQYDLPLAVLLSLRRAEPTNSIIAEAAS